MTKFLTEVLNTRDFPLTVLDRPIESETAKIIENSYRATILAFLDEWSLFAERNGIDLVKVIEAIRVRPTHDNIIFPGPGIGGIACRKTGPSACGRTSTFSASRMTSSRSPRWRSTSTTPGRYMSRN